MDRFTKDLEWSNNQGCEPYWEAFYYKVWPNLVGMYCLNSSIDWQRRGIDRIIYLPNGRYFTVDEKKRRKDYDDILLEVWSVWRANGDKDNKPGWTFDRNKTCDFIAYAIVPAQKCYLLPFDTLRRTARACFAKWKKRRRAWPIDTRKNVGYITRNIAVPWKQLRKDMAECSVFPWGLE